MNLRQRVSYFLGPKTALCYLENEFARNTALSAIALIRDAGCMIGLQRAVSLLGRI
jgi:hypothetical protein